MESPKVSNDFIDFSIRKFKSLISQRNRPSKQRLQCYQHCQDSLYDEAKQNETKTRNLRKALSLYVKAALVGEKVNSCIKDFASVLHQCGYTCRAISFLQQMRGVYKGDLQKYDRLIKNLTQQLTPTGKHEYKNILIDLVDIRLMDSQYEINQMFGNSSRIRSIECFQDLGFVHRNMRGRYILLQFDSFSAAKKTLETFKEDQWFGINKFWIDSSLHVVGQAFNGKNDFERGVILNKGQIQKINGQLSIGVDVSAILTKFKYIFVYKGLERQNQISVYLIQNYVEVAKCAHVDQDY